MIIGLVLVLEDRVIKGSVALEEDKAMLEVWDPQPALSGYELD